MKSSCDAPGLMPLETAMTRMTEALAPIQEQLAVKLQDCLGKVLAEPVLSPFDVPQFTNAAMDGYALRAEDLIGSRCLTLVGKSLAGQPLDGECQPGQCIRIMTGAALPPELDTVVMQENVSLSERGDKITFPEGIKPGQHVRRRGEELGAGSQVLAAGTVITPREVGMLAALGVDGISVMRPLKVAIFSTGDELKTPGSKLKAGEIFDSNRFAIHALLKQMPVELLDLGVIPDDEAQIRAAFEHADREADAVITSGGVSVGEADHTKPVMAALGQISIWKLAIKPGKPFAFGTLPNSYFFGLPGNPVSALVTFYQLVQPMLYHLQGAKFRMPPVLPAIAQTDLRKSPGRADYQRGIASLDPQGQLQVKATGAQGSAIFTSLVKANCFIVLERERGRVAAGETVQVQFFNRLLE